jgi:P-type Ca2+ transporter type 2C
MEGIRSASVVSQDSSSEGHDALNTMQHMSVRNSEASNSGNFPSVVMAGGASGVSSSTAPPRRMSLLKSTAYKSLSDSFRLTPDDLGEIVNFDRRSDPEQIQILNEKYGGVEGISHMLKSDLVRGLKLKMIKDEAGEPKGVSRRRSSKVNPEDLEAHTAEKKKSKDVATQDMATLDAAKRIEIFGSNKIPPPRSDTILEIVWETIKEDPIIKILLLGVVFVLSIETSMCPSSGWVDGVVIIIAVFLVLSVTAGNDYSKDKKFKKLLLLQSDKKVKTIRGGIKDEISSVSQQYIHFFIS